MPIRFLVLAFACGLIASSASLGVAGNRSGARFVPMLKSASLYFGCDSGQRVRREEPKASVELGELQFLGEAKEPVKPLTKEKP